MSRAPKTQRYTMRIGKHHRTILDRIAKRFNITTAELTRIAPIIACLYCRTFIDWEHTKEKALQRLQNDPPWKKP